MVDGARYFPLSMEQLRAIGSWAADCAERALPVYEKHADSDSRPRDAIEGIRVFAGGEKAHGQAADTCIRRRFPPRVRSVIRLLPPPPAPRDLPLRAHTRIRWRMCNRQSTLSVRRPMPHWRLSSTRPAIPNIGEVEVRWAIEHAPPEVREVLHADARSSTG